MIKVHGDATAAAAATGSMITGILSGVSCQRVINLCLRGMHSTHSYTDRRTEKERDNKGEGGGGAKHSNERSQQHQKQKDSMLDGF